MAPRVSFRRHVGLKVAAVALAGLLWLIVSGEQTVERAVRIPLEFSNLPESLEITGQLPTVVDVRVRGSSGALNRIVLGELVAVLDLRAARPGARLFHLGGADVRSPFGVEVVQVTPATVPMTFERSGAKVIPVVPRVEGTPADGFVVGAVTADPATVEVLGPASVLATLTEAMTEPVSVTGARTVVTDTVTVGVVDPAVRLRSPLTVRVVVGVEPTPGATPPQ